MVGERRWWAAKEAGLAHLNCIVRNDIKEREAREMQFAENCQRDDVPPLEQARAWKAYLDRYKVTQMEAGNIGPYEAVKIAALPVDQQELAAEVVSSGLIRGRMLDKLAKMARANPERPLQDIIKQLHSSNKPECPGNIYTSSKVT